MLQISMAWLNENWAKCKNDLIASFGPDVPKLLELGSSGLHIIHGAFKTGMKKNEWNIIEFLRAIYLKWFLPEEAIIRK